MLSEVTELHPALSLHSRDGCCAPFPCRDTTTFVRPPRSLDEKGFVAEEHVCTHTRGKTFSTKPELNCVALFFFFLQLVKGLEASSSSPATLSIPIWSFKAGLFVYETPGTSGL